MTKYLLSFMVAIPLVYGATPGMKIYGQTCVECHGEDGKDVSIAGKAIAGSGGTLAKLTGYKNKTFGGDQKAVMEGNVATLSDEELKAVAEFVDSLK
jgi:cytochrome c553